jgi:1-acyl-sn-glycerol-3-phosphate acyltransferase
MRAGVPVVPIAVVGAEESMPVLWKSPRMARLTGLPYVPVTPEAG